VIMACTTEPSISFLAFHPDWSGPSGRIFSEFVTATVTELRRTELVECVEVLLAFGPVRPLTDQDKLRRKQVMKHRHILGIKRRLLESKLLTYCK